MNLYHHLLLFLFLAVNCDMCKSHKYSLIDKAVTVTATDNSDINDSITISNADLLDGYTDEQRDSLFTYVNNRKRFLFTDIFENATIQNVTEDCLGFCNSEAAHYLNDYGQTCELKSNNRVCFKPRCYKGCEQWSEALANSETCQEICVSTQMHSLDLPCISACEMSQRRYWDWQKQLMEPIIQSVKPFLQQSNISESYELFWNIQLPDSFFAYYQFGIKIQYQYDMDNNMSQPWRNLANYHCNQSLICALFEDLVPFVVHKFRFKLDLDEVASLVLYSPATVPFKSPPKGVPLSRPIIKEAFALDHNHIHVVWEPGVFTCGPLKGYILTLEGGNSTLKEVISADIRNFIFDNLLPSTNYTLEISMLNENGEGPSIQTFVKTKDAPVQPKPYNVNLVAVAGEYSIKIKSLESFGETEIVFENENLISDYALYSCLGENIFFVIDVMGNILRITLRGDDKQTDTIPTSDKFIDFKPKKISVDWLNRRLYLAGQMQEEWIIISTDFNCNDHSYPITIKLATHIEQLIVDPVNGWLFLIYYDSIIRINTANNHSEFILENDVGHLSLDNERYLITFFNTSDQEFYESTYDGKYLRNLRFNLFTKVTHIHSFWYIANHLLATNGTHLIRKNLYTDEFDVWAVSELEWCWSVLPITQKGERSLIQKQPVQLNRPENLNAFVTSNMAKITWNHLRLNVYQTENAWRNWNYELEVMDIASNSAFNIRNIKTTYFNVEKLQPNNLYEFRVRTVFGGIHGFWSNALLTRTWPHGEYKFLLASMNGVYEMNETGEHVEQVGQMENVQDFVQVNATIYYINENNRLQCANIMNPEINCSFIATNAVSLAYEWRGDKMYWVDMLKNCVMRANLDGSQRELLPIFGAQLIAVDAYNGDIYYSTGVRLVRRPLGDTLDMDEYEYYHVSTYDDVIRGFALDVLTKRLIWIVRKANGVIYLFHTNTDMPTDDTEYNFLESDIKFGSLKFLHEIDILAWLSLESDTIILASMKNATNKSQIKISKVSGINCINLRSGYIASSDFSVVPDAIDDKSIRIVQASTDEWIIKWHPINSSENYTIFYSILFQYNDSDNRLDEVFKTNEPWIRLDENHWLQSNLNISITPFTYWSSGPTTRAYLQAPITNVAPPKRIRVFVRQSSSPIESSENISAIVRWEAPKNESAYTEITYKIYFFSGNNLHAEKVYNSSTGKMFETVIDGLRIGNTYTLQVQSFISGVTKGGQRSTLQININPDILSKPEFLYATRNFIAEYDLDLETYKVLIQTTSQVEHLSLISSEKCIVWVNENVELISFTAGLQPTKLARMRAEVLSLTVDWIQRIVYWAELEKENDYVVSIYELDLCQFDGKVMTPNKLFSLDKGKMIKDLTILPFSNILLWLEFDAKSNGSSLAGRHMNNSTFITLKNAKYHKIFVGSQMDGLEIISVIDSNGNACTFDIQRCLCRKQNNIFMGNNVLSSEVDRDRSYIYVLKNDSVYAYSTIKNVLKYEVNITDIQHIKAYNYQRYPDRRCLLPDHDNLLKNIELLRPKIIDIGECYLSVVFPPVHEVEKCELKVPGVKYTLFITDNDNATRSFTTFKNFLNVTDLSPFTNYTLQLTISTYYQRKLKLEEFYSEAIPVRTGIGNPYVPRNFTAYSISPFQIYVTWDNPVKLNCEKVFYKLYWQEKDAVSAGHKHLDSLDFLITSLDPSQQYIIRLEVFCKENKFNTTRSIAINTFDAPPRLRILKKAAYNLTLSWIAPPNVTRTVVACQEFNGENEFSIDITQNSSVIVVPDLEPKTKYEFFLEIFYGTPLDPYIWPELPSEYFIFETLGDAPGRPGQPQIEHTVGDVFRIFWDAAPNNGEKIAEYSLEALQNRFNKRIRRSQLPYNDFMNNSIIINTQTLWAEEPSPIEDQWITVCNTTKLNCIIREIYIRRLLMFRVRARNDLYGWGPYSLDSELISEPFVSPEKRDSLVLAIITPAAIVSTFVVILIILRTFHVRRQKVKISLEKGRPSIWSNISTLQQQQVLASRYRAFSAMNHSNLYTGGPLSDADIALLPHINWSRIKIQNFLGSGTFGEVYEGLIKYENCDQLEKVAIKSLRKGASEFSELLQEAQLMSNFKHDNIVRLIGVCFDTESISIIMENMEAGDLLSYLRDSRPNSKRSTALLQLLDLVSMCIDVCKGCSYLEHMRFVHRDLACRNCLVSSNDPSKRMVKIGDFGLTRDIYKNDYYRKEGEGLLPVRWMSPESLIDGVFTTQSDVWAFSVLCWEILTLGQQPYAAKNNYEVLNYVKDGGRLDKPDNCPDNMFNLFLKCWNKEPDDRPSFVSCLNQLIEIKTELRRTNLVFESENDEYVVYANQIVTPLSTFQTKSVLAAEMEISVPHKLVDKSNQDNKNTSEQLNTFYQDVDIESISDNSQLIGVSRL